MTADILLTTGMGFVTDERAFLHEINNHASGAVLHKHGSGGGGERVVLPGPDGAIIEVGMRFAER
jgi:hypothetical protein